MFFFKYFFYEKHIELKIVHEFCTIKKINKDKSTEIVPPFLLTISLKLSKLSSLSLQGWEFNLWFSVWITCFLRAKGWQEWFPLLQRARRAMKSDSLFYKEREEQWRVIPFFTKSEKSNEERFPLLPRARRAMKSDSLFYKERGEQWRAIHSFTKSKKSNEERFPLLQRARRAMKCNSLFY